MCFQVIRAVTINTTVFWKLTPFSVVDIYDINGSNICFYLLDIRTSSYCEDTGNQFRKAGFRMAIISRVYGWNPCSNEANYI